MLHSPKLYWTLGFFFLVLIMSVVIGEWQDAGGTYLISVAIAAVLMLWVRARNGKFHSPMAPLRILWTIFLAAWIWPLFFPRHYLHREHEEEAAHGH